MQRIEITEAELLGALNEALGDRDTEDGYTCREIMDTVGWGKDKTRRTLETLIIADKWERVLLSRTSVLDDVTRTKIKGYRPVVPSD